MTIWSNYSNNDGYNIAFDGMYFNEIKGKLIVTKRETDGDLDYGKIDINWVFGKVIYDDKTKKTIIRECLEGFLRYLEINNIEGDSELIAASTIFFSEIGQLACFIKDKSFIEEDEYRIAVGISQDDIPKIRKHRSRDGIVIPYIPLNFRLKNNKIPIKGITIGPNIKDEIAKKGVKILLNDYKYNDVEIRSSEIPLRF